MSMLFFNKNANPHPKGSHEYNMESIRRETDLNELLGCLNADVQNLGSIRQQKPQEEDEEKRLKFKRSQDLFSCRMARWKELLYQDGNSSVVCREQATHLILQRYSEFFPRVLRLMPTPVVPFEARKHIAAIFNILLDDQGQTFGGYVCRIYDDVMMPICQGFTVQQQSPDTALLCGTMYRSTLRHAPLYRKLLDSPGPSKKHEPSQVEQGGSKDSSSLAHGGERKAPSCHEKYFYPLLDKYVFVPNFDAASDALATIREVFTNDKAIASEYLERDYDRVFEKYNRLLQHDSYVTKRMGLKLLGEILLDRSNFHVMIPYISNRHNLRIVMNLLRDSSGNIQFEAFHVFKIFVANPNKPADVINVLAQNKVKLVAYLQQFHCDRENGDDQFRDEKTLLINTLNGLVAQEVPTTTTT